MRKIIVVYICMIGVFLLETLLFMLYHQDVYGVFSGNDWQQVLWHSLPHDLTVAGYVVALPLVLKLVHYWLPGGWYRTFCVWFFTIMSLPLALLWMVDMELFSYWGFRLDATPLIYLLDSPGETLGQVSWWQYLLLILALVIIVWLVNIVLRKLFPAQPKTYSHLWREAAAKKSLALRRRIVYTCGGVLLAGFCFVAIRGGVTESTMNIGRAYFSNEMMLNQAAVNPAFSFIYSVSRRQDYGQMYRFMSSEDCELAMQELEELGVRSEKLGADTSFVAADNSSLLTPHFSLSEAPHFSLKRPNVLLLILEGFSGKALSALYPDEADPRVMPNLTRLSNEGVFFTRFYANSWRTDRGVASILAAYPAQPKTTVMKEQTKCNHLQYITKSMAEEGYDLEFVYGGDVNFTNMQGFLRAGGIERIYGNTDFPMEQQIQKWGVPDEFMYNFLYDEIKQQSSSPWMKIALTLSSHEPFDVPNFLRIPEHEFANSLAYADSCLGVFIDRLKADENLWENLLVIALPDHCCQYPDLEMQDPQRYHIPMLWLGGAVLEPRKIEVLGQQTDLAATLLAQLGIDHSEFNFSHDLMANDHRPFAFYDFPDGFGLITDSCQYVQDNQQDGVPLKWSNDPEGKAQRWGRAYLQHLFDDLDKR